MKKYGFIVSDGQSAFRRTNDSKKTVMSVLSQKVRQIAITQNVMSFDEAWTYVVDLSKRTSSVKITLLYMEELPVKWYKKIFR